METHGGAVTDKVLHRAWAYYVLAWVHTLGRERLLRDRLVELGRVRSGESVLDVGCGMGSLAIAAKGRVGPSGLVSGVDPSPEMVARARRKGCEGPPRGSVRHGRCPGAALS